MWKMCSPTKFRPFREKREKRKKDTKRQERKYIYFFLMKPKATLWETNKWILFTFGKFSEKFGAHLIFIYAILTYISRCFGFQDSLPSTCSRITNKCMQNKLHLITFITVCLRSCVQISSYSVY